MVESKKKARGFESKARRRLLNIKYKQRKTDIFISNDIIKKSRPICTYVPCTHVPLVDIIMRRKMTTFGHITRYHYYSTWIWIYQHVESKRKKGIPNRNRMNDIFEFLNLSLRKLLNIAKDRSKWRNVVSSLSCAPSTMATSRD